MKTITVEDSTWKALSLLKIKYVAGSLDEVISKLLKEAGA